MVIERRERQDTTIAFRVPASVRKALEKLARHERVTLGVYMRHVATEAVAAATTGAAKAS